jgi:hypothetical protein
MPDPEKAVSPRTMLEWILQDMLRLVIATLLSFFFLFVGLAKLLSHTFAWMNRRAPKPSGNPSR